ncbi:MAG: rhomboid family intramembrane serine protease [Nanoarchaeota archaeon]
MAITTESRFIWKLLLLILLTPVTLIQVLMKKKEAEALFLPFSETWKFLFEAKCTITIILLNIVIFVLELFLAPETLERFAMHPADLFSTHAYTLITAGFLHANAMHLIGNMIALFIFGRVVERKFGKAKTALIYFGALIISGVFSSIIHTFILHDNSAGIGASGAIMGIIAAAILLDPFYLTWELLIPLPIMVVGWLTIAADIMGILNPVEDGIGHFAHLGGFLSIALLLYLFGTEDRKKIRKGFVVNVVSLIIIAAVYFFLI